MAPTTTAVFRAVADFASLNREVRKTRREIEQLQAQSGKTDGFDKFNAALENTAKVQDKLRKETDALSASQAKLGKGSAGLSSLNKSLESIAGSQEKAAKSSVAFSDAHERQLGVAQSLRGEMGELGKSVRSVSSAEDAAAKSARDHTKALNTERSSASTKTTVLSKLAEGLRKTAERDREAADSASQHAAALDREADSAGRARDATAPLGVLIRDAGTSAKKAASSHDSFATSLGKVATAAQASEGAVRDHSTSVGASAAAASSASGAHASFAGSLSSTATNARQASSATNSYSRSASQVGANSRSASNDTKALSSAFNSVGSSARSGASGAGVFGAALNPLRSGLRSAGEAGQGLKVILLGLAVPAVTSGILLLGGSLSALVAALVSTVAAAGPAVGVLAALAPAALAAAGGIGTIAVSFRGVGDALKAMSKLEQEGASGSAAAAQQRVTAARSIAAAQRGVRDAVQSQQDAEVQGARSVADAQRSLDRARSDAADSAVAASERVEDAQEDLVLANERVLRAEEGLHDARQQAIRDLEDLAERTGDNALSQESAEIRLLRAQERQQEVNADIKSTSLDRREAALRVAEAEDNLSDVQRQSTRDASDLNEARQQGVNGMPGVVSAQDSLSSAMRSQRDAAENLTDAQAAAAKSQRDSAQSIADAERNLAETRQDAARRQRDAAERVQDAMLRLAEAQADAAQSSNAMSAASRDLAAALDKLSPKGREFVQLLFSMRGKLDELTKAGQEAMFPGLIRSIKLLVPLIDSVFLPSVRAIGSVIGAVVERASQEVLSWQNDLIQFGTSDAPVLLDQFGTIMVNLASAMQDVGVAAVPLLAWLTALGVRLSDYWKAEAEGARQDGSLALYFEKVRLTLALLGAIVFNLGGQLKSLFQAAQPYGQQMLVKFEELTRKAREWMNSTAGKDRLNSYFKKTSANAEKVLSLLSDMALAFLKMGESETLGKLLDSLDITLKPSLTKFFEALGESVAEHGPELIQLLSTLLDILTELMGGPGGGLSAFIAVLQTFADVLLAIISIPGIGELASILLAIAGGLAAIKAVGKIANFMTLGATRGANLAGGGAAAKADRAATGGKGTKGAPSTAVQGLRAGLVGRAPGPAQTGTARVGQFVGTQVRRGAGLVAAPFAGPANAVRSSLGQAAQTFRSGGMPGFVAPGGTGGPIAPRQTATTPRPSSPVTQPVTPRPTSSPIAPPPASSPGSRPSGPQPPSARMIGGSPIAGSTSRPVVMGGGTASTIGSSRPTVTNFASPPATSGSRIGFSPAPSTARPTLDPTAGAAAPKAKVPFGFQPVSKPVVAPPTIPPRPAVAPPTTPPKPAVAPPTKASATPAARPVGTGVSPEGRRMMGAGPGATAATAAVPGAVRQQSPAVAPAGGSRVGDAARSVGRGAVAAGGMAAGIGGSIAGGMAGQQLGQKIGGDTGGMVGGIAGSVIGGMAPEALAAGFQKLGPAIAKVQSGLSSAGGAAKTALSSFGSLAVSAGAAAVEFLKMGVQAGIAAVKTIAVNAASLVVRAGIVAWTAVQWLLNAALNANPIGLVVIAITALVAALIWAWNNSETFRAIVIGMWEGIKAAFQAAMAFITPIWNAFWNALSAVATAIWDTFGAYFTAAWTILKALFQGGISVISGIWAAFWNLISTVAMAVWNAVSAFFVAAWEVFKAAWQVLVDLFSGNWSNLWNSILALGKAVWNLIVTFFTGAWEVFKTVFQALLTFFSTIWNTSWEAIKTAAVTIWNAIKAFFDTAWNAWKAAFQAVVDFVKSLWDGFWNLLKTVAETAWNWLKTGIETALNFISNLFQTVVDNIKKIWEGIKEAVAIPIRFVVNTVWNNGVVALWNKVADLLPGVDPIEPYVLPFATGGTVPGAGNTDSVKAVLTPGEFVVRKQVAEPARKFLEALNAGEPEAFQATGAKSPVRRYNKGGSVDGDGYRHYAVGGVVDKGLNWARGQAGKPYVWGGVGPGGYDCSGFMSAITNVLNDRPAHRRVGTTGSAPWGGWANGLSSAFGVGYFKGDPGHMAGTLGGANVESAGGKGTQVGSGARGATNSMFTGHMSLPMVGGQFVDGGSGGDAWYNPLPEIVEGFFSTLVDPLIGQIDRLAKPPPKWNAVPKSTATNIRDNLYNYLMDLASASAGSEAGSGPAQEQVRAVAARFGWNEPPEWDEIVRLVNKESGWDPNAANPSSSARGLFQKMTSIHGPIEPTPAGQAEWGLNYIKGRYGTPSRALAFHDQNNYYAQGGLVYGFGSNDSQPAMLTPGEFIVRKEAVDSLGLGTLRALNASSGSVGAGSESAVQRFAMGGAVQKSGGMAYQVMRGDSLSVIARKFNTTVAELARLNKIGNINKIFSGQWLNLPSKPTAQTSAKPATSDAEVDRYQIKKGDTLWALAQRFKTTVDSLARLNNIKDPSKIYTGSWLSVPKAGTKPEDVKPGTPDTTSTSPAADTTVEEKETLSSFGDSIAKNTAAQREFESILLQLTRWGYSDLALSLSKKGMGAGVAGDGSGLALSREAIKSPSAASKVNTILQDSTDVVGDSLETVLAVMAALQKTAGLGLREVSTATKIGTKEIFDSLSARALAEVAKLPSNNREKFLSNIDSYKRGLPFAFGGPVGGTGNRDTVPALLTPGEFVLRKAAAAKIGMSTLHRLNQADALPVQAFAQGGQVMNAADLFSLVSPPNISRPRMDRAVQEKLAAAVEKSGSTTNSKSVVFNEGAVKVMNPAPARAADSFESVMQKLTWAGAFS